MKYIITEITKSIVFLSPTPIIKAYMIQDDFNNRSYYTIYQDRTGYLDIGSNISIMVNVSIPLDLTSPEISINRIKKLNVLT